MRAVRIRKAPVITVALVIVGLVVLALVGTSSAPKTQAQAAFSATLDPGTPLHGVAPNFTLTDQFDRPVSLKSYRGKVVLLAFDDSQCTTICPLTTTAMVEAKRMLGAAGSKLALLGIDANPRATSVKDVRSYSELHGMTHLWRFGTAPLPQLKRVWNAYHIGVEIQAGQIDHTPALFVINPQGRLVRLYLTQMSYSSVTQEAQILAREVSRLLPGHPPVHSRLSYADIKTITPAQHTSLPLVGHGTLRLGPGSPRLLLFFASWDQQVMDLKSHLDALNAYAAGVRAGKLPPLVAVDEGTVEPSAAALPRLLSQLPVKLRYPVAIDHSGRVADGYGVQDEPWLVLVSKRGAPLWFHDVSTAGWPSAKTLRREVTAALSKPSGALSEAAVKAELAGSPPALASLHAQADRVIGSESALAARIRALRGYPVVVNVWASWCAPCREEFGLLASAAARYGRQVAFLGADIGDNATSARAFLRQHHVSYPSYPVTYGNIGQILPQGVVDTPTTIFFNSAGRITHTQVGQYQSQGTLDSDVATYALGAG